MFSVTPAKIVQPIERFLMIRYGRYPLEPILEAIGRTVETNKTVYYEGVRIKPSHRLQLFYLKGITCGTCGIVGEFFAAEGTEGVTPHLNLYAVDENGDDVLMTKDHIVPKSRGGANALRNYQTMCSPCNGAKADTHPTALRTAI